MVSRASQSCVRHNEVQIRRGAERASIVYGDKRVLGVWDLQASPISLGGLLILAEELQIQRAIHGVSLADVCVVGEISQLKLSVRRRFRGVRPLQVTNDDCSGSALLSLLSIDGLAELYVSHSRAGVQWLMDHGRSAYIPWPRSMVSEANGRKFDNTMFCQQFYRERGFIPFLSVKQEARDWALDFARRLVSPLLPVAVHLKNNPGETGMSNAHLDAWLGFFKSCEDYRVRFILIGRDEIDIRIRRQPNVLLARDYDSNLPRDLALVQTAWAFMGMASGPCNMAIFNGSPYVIYKNPGHHRDEMQLELGNAEHFQFGSHLQKMLRKLETVDGLMVEFKRLYKHADRRDG